jgi:uncharacterized membrane protein YsdA (DUF1294 family)
MLDVVVVVVQYIRASTTSSEYPNLITMPNLLTSWYILINAVGFGLAAGDKLAAKIGHNRTSHATLCKIASFGGFIGQLIAFIVFNHKTRAVTFQRQFATAVAKHLAVRALLWWLGILRFIR